MMGIYIKGMEMPTGCEACYFHRWVDIGVGACAGCELLKELMNDGRDRLPDCPLIPVPPHGRLIDADALKGMMIDALNDALPECRTDWYRKIMRDTTIAFMQDIDECPTIIPADFIKDSNAPNNSKD